VGAKLDRTGCRDQPTDPTDRRDQLGDRVLGGDRVLRTVESSTRRAFRTAVPGGSMVRMGSAVGAAEAPTKKFAFVTPPNFAPDGPA
jgi:hypothetical protein